MNDAFISYSRRNKEFVQQLNESFKQHQRQVWVDWEDIPLGAKWWQEIERGIEQANAVIFVLSPDSSQSSVCQQEIEHALKQNKRIIPIVHQEVVPAQVHPHLAALNWIFFTQPENFDSSFQALLTTLDTDLDSVRAHTRLLNRAIEWDHQRRDSSFLLRGKELHAAEQWLSSNTKTPQPTILQTQYVMKSSQRQARQQRAILMITVIGLVMTIALALFAEQKSYEAIKHQIIALGSLSKIRLVTHDDIGSLLASIEATKQIQRLWYPSADLQRQIKSVFRESINSVQERNRLEGHTGVVHDMVYSPDGQLIVSTGSDQTVKLWRQDGTLLVDHKLESRGWSVDFSPDGKRFVVVSAKGLIDLWDVPCLLQHREQISTCQFKTLQQARDAKSIIFTPDGQGLVVGSIRDMVINLWNIEEGKIIRTLSGHRDSIEDLSISPDGQWLASASADNTVKIWRMYDGQLSQTLEGHEDRVYGVKFSPQDHLLASVSADNTMILWGIKDKQWFKQRTVNAHSNWINVVDFSNEGQFIATGSSDKTIKIWNADGLLLKTLWGHQSDVTVLSFSPDGKTIASGGDDTSIRLYSLDSMQIKILEGHRSSLKDVIFSPHGDMLISVSTDKTIKFWDAQRGTLRKSQDLPSGARKIEISPHGHMFALAGYDKHVRLLDEEGRITTQWSTMDSVKSLALSPDGQFIATADTERVIKLWRLDGTLVNTFGDGQQGHQWTINDITFSPDGQLLASASADATIKLWQLDGRLVKTLTGHQSWVNSISFSRDGKYLVSASSDHKVRIWTREGTLVRTLEGHTNWVWQAKFNPDHTIIASASADHTVKLWNFQGELLSTLGAHKNWVRALSFSPDGSKLVTASADQTVILWDLTKELEKNQKKERVISEELLLKQGCDWLHDYLKTNQNLSEDERDLCD